MVSTLKNMSKEMEMNILNHLWEHASYFRDAFTVNDFNLMLKNIKEDHPLLMGTEISEAAHHWGAHLGYIKKSMTAKYPCEVSREIMEGKIVMSIKVVDVFNEGKATIFVRENKSGTSFRMSVVIDEPIEKFPDICDGISRIMYKIAAEPVYKLIERHFYKLDLNVVAKENL